MRRSCLQALAADSDFSQPNNRPIVSIVVSTESRINGFDRIEENNCLLRVTRNELKRNESISVDSLTVELTSALGLPNRSV
jgi:hypothetical protein